MSTSSETTGVGLSNKASRTGATRPRGETAAQALELRLAAIQFAAEDINIFEFAARDGSDLPPFSAGAHIDVHLPRGIVRSYSLCNDPSERSRYQIAVLRQSAGRGGSISMHDELRCGSLVRVSPPKNNFPLDWSAARHKLVAGGIGITPMVAMLYELERSQADYVLHYCARSPDRMAFRECIERVAKRGKVFFYLDDGNPKKGLDVGTLLGGPGREGEHIYVCGPPSLILSVRDAAGDWPQQAIHSEYFAPPPAPIGQLDDAQSFEVVLARTGGSVIVGPGVSISSALERAGVFIPTSCEQGVCGTCMVRYLAGEPDHRDFVLSEAERTSFIMTCCSRAKSPRIVLDL